MTTGLPEHYENYLRYPISQPSLCDISSRFRRTSYPFANACTAHSPALYAGTSRLLPRVIRQITSSGSLIITFCVLENKNYTRSAGRSTMIAHETDGKSVSPPDIGLFRLSLIAIFVGGDIDRACCHGLYSAAASSCFWAIRFMGVPSGVIHPD
jgi:hypothetical protein